MKIATLEFIHRMMVEEVKRQENALSLVRDTRRKAQDDYDTAIDNECSEEEAEAIKRRVAAQSALHTKIWAELDCARDALSDFENHDWN